MDPTQLARLALLAAVLAVARPTAPAGDVNAATGTATYIVQAGDTLYSIAVKFNTTVAILEQLNHITDPNTLTVGQRLVLPGTIAQNVVPPTPTARGPTAVPQTAPPAGAGDTSQSDTYIIRAGDTLATIAARFGTSVAELQRVNNISNPNVISVGQRLIIPNASPQPLPDGIALDPQIVRQGNTVVISVTTPGVSQVLGKFDQQQLKFNPINGAWVALAGISRCANYLGNFPVTLQVSDSLGNPKAVQFNIRVNPTQYDIQDLTLTPQMAALLDPAVQNAENARVAMTVGVYTPGQLWTGPFRLPLDVTNPRISTNFGDRRSYNGGKPGLCGHEGRDYAVPGGTPVYAPAAGVIAMATPLTVRGNVVFIDHGRGIFSGFYHLSEIDTTAGQRVQAGDLLGKVGTTGFSTGDHLHWSLWVNGVYVDPNQWMQEAIP